MLRRSIFSLVFCICMIGITESHAQSELALTVRLKNETVTGGFDIVTRDEKWQSHKTALIVCDAWDYHHCFNAVRRLEQFAPRLNDVVAEARKRGVTIIHSPSDCMDAYADHPGRTRAINATKADFQPHDIGSWCSVIPAEERGVYPVDQSDGGEDDDPDEHAKWAAKLTQMGRNPNAPWKEQTGLIKIDANRDYITDKGPEVWNILQEKGIDNVILTGVHLNMCVLGRPFGLRQMSRNGKNVVLMRDMTDTMYNPKSWPHVSHFEGTRRVIAHVERYVCPTITSDQLVGGKQFRFKGDIAEGVTHRLGNPRRDGWSRIYIPKSGSESFSDGVGIDNGPKLCRCVVRIPANWTENVVTIQADSRNVDGSARAWLNGKPLESTDAGSWVVKDFAKNDANLLVVTLSGKNLFPAVMRSGDLEYSLAGNWLFRNDVDETQVNIPLPAKFGGSADNVFSPPEPLWTPRPLTRIGQFTTGIEGPACDRDGNVYAVNFTRQGTIGRVRPDGVGEIFVELPDGSIGNGIRFDSSGEHFYVADYTNHNILKINVATRAITVHAHNDKMNQPNDLAIAPDGTLYASDPNWKQGTGQLWRINTDGTTTRLAADMGTTNGIEVSPDGKTLYVNESKQRNLWAFAIAGDKTLSDKRLIKQFPDHGFDGMRTDVDGNLYVTRHGKGVIIKVTPAGKILQEIHVLGTKPSNICFGGPDGCTAYVTEVDSRRIVTFRVDRPGRSHSSQH